MSELPTVPLGRSDIMVTRLMSGGNPLCGNSHFSNEMSADMGEYFTSERVVAYLLSLQSAGINTLQARGDYDRILHWIELFRRHGGQLHWIAQTASEMSDVFQNIRILAAAGAIGVYHHGTQTDRFWLEGNIDKVSDYLKCMRDSGIQVGIGTHIPEVIKYAEEKDWDIDFYMASFYNLSRKPRESALVQPGGQTAQEEFLSEDPARMCQVIRQTEKMCLAFKILGASRMCSTQREVEAAFQFAFSNIKPKDAVVVGMFPKELDQIALNVQYTKRTCGNFDPLSILNRMYKFDMGTPGSPVRAGYTQVHITDIYSPECSFGWSRVASTAFDRTETLPCWLNWGHINPKRTYKKVPHWAPINFLTRGGIQDPDEIEFRIDVPDGDYWVRVTCGDPFRSCMHLYWSINRDTVMHDLKTRTGWGGFVTDRTTRNKIRVRDGRIDISFSNRAKKVTKGELTTFNVTTTYDHHYEPVNSINAITVHPAVIPALTFCNGELLLANKADKSTQLRKAASLFQSGKLTEAAKAVEKISGPRAPLLQAHLLTWIAGHLDCINDLELVQQALLLAESFFISHPNDWDSKELVVQCEEFILARKRLLLPLLFLWTSLAQNFLLKLILKEKYKKLFD